MPENIGSSKVIQSFELTPDAILVSADESRAVVIRPSSKYPEIMRVYSCPFDEFDIDVAGPKVGRETDDRIVILPSKQEIADTIIGLFPNNEVQIATKLPDAIDIILRKHLKNQGTTFHYCVVNNPPELPHSLQRAHDRLGDDGYALLGGVSVFAEGRAAYRLAVKTYLEHKALEASPNERDSLVRELVAWNLVSQAYMTLENFAALFSAMKATRSGNFAAFAEAYLRFGRMEKGLQSDGVSQIMESLAGKNGHNVVAEILQIPLDSQSIEDCGLKNCGIDERTLITAGQYTRDFVMFNMRRLAKQFVGGINPMTKMQTRTVPVRAYGAFRHGFAIGFPLHDPRMSIIGNDAEQFRDESHYIDYMEKSQKSGEILSLGDPTDATGNREVIRIPVPVYTEHLKQFVQIVYLTRRWISEFSNYAISRYGSVNGQFPYLVNFSRVLGDADRALLQKRLDEMSA